MENKIYCEDCLEGMKKLEDNSVDLVVTDPPYGFSFMQKDWDKAVPSVEIWKECLRILKPGAFAFIMSAPRQDVLSQMIVKLGQAGFNINFTSIYWAYASGFPKAVNIGKLVDKKFGAEREVTGIGKSHVSGKGIKNNWNSGYKIDYNITKPSSPQAKSLDGSYSGFQPKPAVEIIIVAMKPLSENSSIEQSLKNGKGVTWLDKCRIPFENEDDKESSVPGGKVSYGQFVTKEGIMERDLQDKRKPSSGRFPANLLVSDDVLNVESKGVFAPVKSGQKGFGGNIYGKYKNGGDNGKSFYSDKETNNSFSRYFDLDKWWEERIKELPEEVRKTFPFLIVSKPSVSEKNKECKSINPKFSPTMNDGIGNKEHNEDTSTKKNNHHPTVKPVTLMSYLITLGSRKDDLILDPFMGSGTTCMAAKLLNRRFIGYENNSEYYEIALNRINNLIKSKSLFDFENE